MPKIYEYFGFVLFFYSNEHAPIHVHVKKQDRESVFEIIMQDGILKEVRLRPNKKNPLSNKEIAETKRFVEIFANKITQKWINYFVYNKVVRCGKISKKV